MDWINDNAVGLLTAALALSNLVSAIVALTPTEVDDRIWGRIKNVLSVWGLKK